MPKTENCTIREDIGEFINGVLRASTGKIAILVPVFSKYDGAGRVAKQQAKELSKIGYSVAIFTLESDINSLETVKVEVLGAPKNFFLNRVYRALFFLDIRAINWASKLRDFDLVIAHHYPLTYLAYVAKRRYNTRYCFFNHGQPPYEVLSKILSRNPSEKIYNFLMNKIEDFTIKNADYAVSNSKFSREMLVERSRIDSIVIYNKIDKERFKESLDGLKVRKKYGIKEFNPLILFVGRVVPSKGVHLLIEVFKLVKQKIPDAKLMIVGNPYYKDYFKKLNEMSDESVIFAGYVSDEELPYHYAACDIYTTCSLWEGFNLPLAEAQVCGKPVIAFDIGPHKEIVKNGFLVKLWDIKSFSQGIIKCLETPSKSYYEVMK